MIEKAQKKTGDEKTKQKPPTKARPPHPAVIFRKAQLDPNSVIQLRSTIGNRGVEELVEGGKDLLPKQSSPAQISQLDSLYEEAKKAIKTYNDNLDLVDEGGARLYEIGMTIHYIKKWKDLASKLGGVNNPNLSKRWLYLEDMLSTLEKEVPTVQKNGILRALNTHLKDRERLLDYLKEYQETRSKSEDPVIRSTCELIESGKVSFYAATPTGDWWLRVMESKKDPKEYRAYFTSKELNLKGDTITDNDPVYNYNNLKENSNVTLIPAGQLGWIDSASGKDAVVIVNPSSEDRKKEDILETIQRALLFIIKEKSKPSPTPP